MELLQFSIKLIVQRMTFGKNEALQLSYAENITKVTLFNCNIIKLPY